MKHQGATVARRRKEIAKGDEYDAPDPKRREDFPGDIEKPSGPGDEPTAKPWDADKHGAGDVPEPEAGDADKHGQGDVFDESAPRPGVGAGLKGSKYLQAERARFKEELKNTPGLRDELAAMASFEHEGDPIAPIESLMNRMNFIRSSIHSGLHSGFYGPINKGLLASRVQELRSNPARMARLQSAIDAAFSSNLLRGATDQGSPSDPNADWPGGRMVREGEVYNDWGGGAGHEAARLYRENQQRQVAQGGDAEAPAGSGDVYDEGTARSGGGYQPGMSRAMLVVIMAA